jgi:hypothetical protein
MKTIKKQLWCWEKNVLLKKLIHRLVHSHDEGVTLATDEINSRRTNQISKQALINKLNPDGSIDSLNITDFENIVNRLKFNFEIAQHFAAPINAIVVRMPTVPEGDLALLDDFMAIAREIGDISAKFQLAYADGKITALEYETVEIEVKQAVGALLRFQESVKLRVSK